MVARSRTGTLVTLGIAAVLAACSGTATPPPPGGGGAPSSTAPSVAGSTASSAAAGGANGFEDSFPTAPSARPGWPGVAGIARPRPERGVGERVRQRPLAAALRRG
jgi:hypothetical protein